MSFSLKCIRVRAAVRRWGQSATVTLFNVDHFTISILMKEFLERI